MLFAIDRVVEDIAHFTTDGDEFCISFFLATHLYGKETTTAPARLRKLVSEALAIRPSIETSGVLHEVQKLVEDTKFWQNQGGGLAIFGSKNHFQILILPEVNQDSVVIDRFFYLRPLLTQRELRSSCSMLVLDKKDTQLYEVNGNSISEIPLPASIKSIEEALKYDDPEAQLQHYSGPRGQGARRSAIFHGHGSGSDGNHDEKERLTRYFRLLDQGIRPLLMRTMSPLLLAGVEYYFPLFEEANTYPYLVDESVVGASNSLDSRKLLDAATNFFQKLTHERKNKRFSQTEELAGTGRVISDIHQIVWVAEQGGVECLWIDTNSQYWGEISAEKIALVELPNPNVHSELINYCVLQVLRTGAKVYIDTISKGPRALLRKGYEFTLAQVTA